MERWLDLKMQYICSDCGSSGKPEKITKGSFLIELLLWLFLLLPGIVYTLWRKSSQFKGCHICGSKNIVLIDTPRGKELIRKYSSS